MILQVTEVTRLTDMYLVDAVIYEKYLEPEPIKLFVDALTSDDIVAAYHKSKGTSTIIATLNKQLKEIELL